MDGVNHTIEAGNPVDTLAWHQQRNRTLTALITVQSGEWVQPSFEVVEGGVYQARECMDVLCEPWRWDRGGT